MIANSLTWPRQIFPDYCNHCWFYSKSKTEKDYTNTSANFCCCYYILTWENRVAQVCWDWWPTRDDWKRVMKCGSLSVNNLSSASWWASDWIQLWWGQGEDQTVESLSLGSWIISPTRAGCTNGIWIGRKEYMSLCTFSCTHCKYTVKPLTLL